MIQMLLFIVDIQSFIFSFDCIGNLVEFVANEICARMLSLIILELTVIYSFSLANI